MTNHRGLPMSPLVLIVLLELVAVGSAARFKVPIERIALDPLAAR